MEALTSYYLFIPHIFLFRGFPQLLSNCPRPLLCAVSTPDSSYHSHRSLQVVRTCAQEEAIRSFCLCSCKQCVCMFMFILSMFQQETPRLLQHGLAIRGFTVGQTYMRRSVRVCHSPPPPAYEDGGGALQYLQEGHGHARSGPGKKVSINHSPWTYSISRNS